MTRRKKEISFEAEWVKAIDSDEIYFLHGVATVRNSCDIGKRIIRALGKKEGKIRITLERIE